MVTNVDERILLNFKIEKEKANYLDALEYWQQEVRNIAKNNNQNFSR